jgi:probable phosphoglycerate mutase
MMETILIRHGDPDYANDTLTEEGHRQAGLLAERLANARIDAIYCSPLGRARMTMEYAAKKIGIEPVICDWLRETGGKKIAGKHPWLVPPHMILGQPDLPSLSNWARDEELYGASVLPHMKRVADGFDTLMGEYGYRREGNLYRVVTPCDKRLAFFSHGGFTLTLLSHLLHMPPHIAYAHLELHTAAVTRLAWQESDGWASPRMVLFNDRWHLQ